MGRFAFHILTVSFHPRPNAECKSSCLSPADVEKLNLGDRFQLKLKACFCISSLLFFFLKLHSNICENRSRSAEHLPSPSPVFYFLQHPQKKLGGKKPSGSVAASSVNVFVSNFWPTWCNSSRASVHKMLIRGWSETPSWTRTASDPLHVCKQGGNGFDYT